VRSLLYFVDLPLERGLLQKPGKASCTSARVLIWSNERVVHHVVGICVGAPQNRHSAGRGMPHQLAEGARVSSARFAHQLGVGGCAARLGCQPLPALRVLSPLTTPPDAVEVRTRALVVRGQASRSGWPSR
jgi:hypothetical protein